jgi:transposase
MSKKPLTITQFFRQFPDDESCLTHLFNVRFGQGFECPKCERASKWFRIKAERAYSCQWCGHHLHPTVGTPFQQTRTPLQLWFYAIYLFTTTRHGVPAKELQRQLGVTYKTAWRMGHEIRLHMADVDGDDMLGLSGAVVEIDETLYGGVIREGTPGPHLENKTVILGMLERGGEVVTKVVPNVRRAHLQPTIVATVARGAEVHTDAARCYDNLSTNGYRHSTVNHNIGQYVTPMGVHTQSIESFWSQLKRGINGTHIAVSGKHLGKYAKEFEYRFNRRNCGEVMLSELLTTFRPLS